MNDGQCGHVAVSGIGTLLTCDRKAGHGGLHQQGVRLRSTTRNYDGTEQYYTEYTNWTDDGKHPSTLQVTERRAKRRK